MIPGEEQEYPEQIDRPTALQLQMSRVMLTNCRQGNRCTRNDLKDLLRTYSHTKLLNKEDFPCKKKLLDGLPSCIINHADNTDHPYFDKTVEDILLDRELPKSFSDQCLEDLLVNSFSQKNMSSPSNTGDSKIRATNSTLEKCTKHTEISSHSHSISNSSHSNTNHNVANGSSINETMQGGEQGCQNGETWSNRRKTMTNQDSVSSVGLTYYNMRTNSFKKDARKDVWCAVIDQVWIEFLGAPSARGRPLPLMESFPLTLWITLPKAGLEADEEHGIIGKTRHAKGSDSQCNKHKDQGDLVVSDVSHKQGQFENTKSDAGFCSHSKNDIGEQVATNGILECETENPDKESLESASVDRVTSDLHIITKVGGQVHIQISHYQYMFLMRLIETVTNFQNELQSDVEQILQKTQAQKSIGVSIMLQEAEIAMVCLPNKDEFANDDSR